MFEILQIKSTLKEKVGPHEADIASRQQKKTKATVLDDEKSLRFFLGQTLVTGFTETKICINLPVSTRFL